MRLCSYRDSREGERLAVVAGDHALPASELLDGGPRTIAELFAGGESLLSALLSAADDGRIARDGRPLAELQLLAPVPHPGKVVAIGRDPKLTVNVDYEAELAVVIGRRARRLSRDQAAGAILGYTCLNDVSAR